MKKETIYIAGKVTGLDTKEVQEKFDAAQEKFIYLGFDVINPIQIVHQYADGFETDWETAMQLCLAKLEEATHIYMLEDWKDSKGATIEHERAKEIGIDIIYQKSPTETNYNYSCIFLIIVCFIFWATVFFLILSFL